MIPDKLCPEKSWDVISNGQLVFAKLSPNPLHITRRNKYCFRITCTFESGVKKKIQTKFYDTREEAMADYPLYQKQAAEKRVAVFKCTVNKFYINWLHSPAYDNTYWRIIGDMVVPKLGAKRINDVTAGDLVKILEKNFTRVGGFSDESFHAVCSAISCFFKDAMKLHCAAQDNGTVAVHAIKERKKAEADIHLTHYIPADTYSPDQLIQILDLCRKEAPDLYLPMLLASLAGLRMVEILQITLDDIDFQNRTLSLPYISPKHPLCWLEPVTISESSTRTVILPDILMSEICCQKERLDALQKADPSFNQEGYLIWDRKGRKRANNFINSPYTRICFRCPFPTFPWRDLRKIRLTSYSMEKLTESLNQKGTEMSKKSSIPFGKNYLLELLK